MWNAGAKATIYLAKPYSTAGLPYNVNLGFVHYFQYLMHNKHQQ